MKLPKKQKQIKCSLCLHSVSDDLLPVDLLCFDVIVVIWLWILNVQEDAADDGD